MSDVVASTRKLRGSRNLNPLGALTDYRRDPLSLFYREAVKHHGSVRIRLAHQNIHLLVEPEHIRHVLAGEAASYTKGISYDSLRHLLGDGLLTSEGEIWQRQTRLIKPAFSRARTASQVPLVVDCALRMIDAVTPNAFSGAVFDLVPQLMSFSLDVVCRIVLGTDIEDLLPQIQRSTPQCERWIIRNMSSLLRLPPAVPTPANLRFQRLRASMWRIIHQIVQRHRDAECDQVTLLGTLMAAHDDRGQVTDDSQLRDEILTFVLAGHETSASGAAWTIYELCQHPDWMQAVIAEIDGVDLGSSDLISAVPRLELTGRSIDEAMRLHPPIWAFTRTAGRADSFRDFDIESGSIVVMSPFVNHRFPDFWPSPLRFDPMRFTEDQVRNRPQLHYFPYGFGVHHCVGVNLAAVAMRVAVALFMSRFDVELVSGMHVGENPQIVNTPDPIMVRIRHRSETK